MISQYSAEFMNSREVKGMIILRSLYNKMQTLVSREVTNKIPLFLFVFVCLFFSSPQDEP